MVLEGTALGSSLDSRHSGYLVVERLTHPLGFALLNLALQRNCEPILSSKSETGTEWASNLVSETGSRRQVHSHQRRTPRRSAPVKATGETRLLRNRYQLEPAHTTNSCMSQATKDVQVKGRNRDPRSLGGKSSHNNLQLTTIWSKK